MQLEKHIVVGITEVGLEMTLFNVLYVDLILLKIKHKLSEPMFVHNSWTIRVGLKSGACISRNVGSNYHQNMRVYVHVIIKLGIHLHTGKCHKYAMHVLFGV